MLNEETSVLSALRREPEQAAILFKLSAITAIVLVAWDVMAAWVLPAVAVKAVLVLLVLAYGATMTYLVAKIMASSRNWASGSAAAASKLASPVRERREDSSINIDALKRKPNELPVPATMDEDDEDEPPARPAEPAPAVQVSESTVFNESYFMMRLQEQVKDARRQGREMCVAAVHVTIPGAEMTPEISRAVAYEMARIASGQTRMMSQPLALSDSEFVFSLPQAGADETRQFVREIVRALGDYWCYFGIATFPRNAHDADGLVEEARIACEASLQSGKRGQVEYSAA